MPQTPPPFSIPTPGPDPDRSKTRRTCWLLVLTLWISSAVTAAQNGSGAQPSPAQRLFSEPEAERMRALAEQQPPATQVLWLETQHESFLGLFEAAERPQPRGRVLLLPHDRTHPDWPGAMQTLRRTLPAEGYTTLAIALPDEPLPLLPLLDPPASAASEANDSLPLDDHARRIRERIDAALAYLERVSGPLYLVGEGSGGYWVVHALLQSQPGGTPILINARQPITPKMPPLHEAVARLSGPALDLVQTPLAPGAEALDAWRLRRASARRAGLETYLGVRLPPQVGSKAAIQPRLRSQILALIEKHLEPARQKAPAPKPAAINQPPG